MNEDNMYKRKEFEQWAVEDAKSVGVYLDFYRVGDWYEGRDFNFLNTAWASWKAALKSTGE